MADMTKQVQELLNEEKWTRATLNNYNIGNFEELDKILNEFTGKEDREEVLELCNEHLDHTKNSIIALYVSGIISLARQLVDDSNLVQLIAIFTDNHKWGIVEFLCERILAFGENKLALRTLSECYENENQDDQKFAIWERLIKVDYEEAEMVMAIAEKREKDGDSDVAVDYYKKAIHRFIGKKQFTNVRDIWQKLLTLCPDDIDFFTNVEKKIAQTISTERASQLLEDLYQYYFESENWDTSIRILRQILTYDPKNQWARKEITDCFRSKYASHSHLEDYVKLANLTQSWRNVHDAIADFEKHISFDAGNFVCHRSWGIGRISGIKGDDITIDFARKRDHVMSLKMAVNALTSLTKDHIWVLKVIWKKDKLRSYVKGDIPATLRTVIRSYDNAANMKMIKAELVPGVLTQGEWTSWSSEARKILKTDPIFGNLPDKADHYMVRETPISFEEKTFNKFTADKDFFGRVQTMIDFMSADPETEYFAEMFSYFAGFLKAFSVVNETVIASYLIVDRIIKKYPFLNPGLEFSFAELYHQIEDVEGTFAAIGDTDLKKDFLEKVKDIDGWADIYIKLFPAYLSRYILDELFAAGYEDKIRIMVQTVTDHYRENREAFIWISRNAEDLEWYPNFEIPYEKILIGMLHLLDITFREINNRREVSLNRKLNKQIQNYLFKDNNLEPYLLEADQDSVTRLFSLVADVKDLDPSVRLELRQKISEKYPDFKFYGEAVAEIVSRGLMVTSKAYEMHQKDLQKIIEVDVPENSKEIGAALELGDLRENAEYKAAKEKQEMLNNTVARIRDEIERAQIFDKSGIDTTKVSFGTKVLLTNKKTKKEEQYTILGPWESDPTNKVISYLSPFGAELLNHKPGDNLSFVINEREYEYAVQEITKGDF